MLKDHNHDLIHSLSEKNDAVWRYEGEYTKNAEGCEFCQNLWRQLAEDDNRHIEMIKEEIKRHISEERFD
ncbi:MAG: hypothetical protein A2909_01665 [Candidatus Tagabacteria bacterium RIFCSPLOWO2_01_FULL_39_11]|uniref:Rubrerythrin diiron-binding domain-containing protein n=1 Tax=Candidatus Tagabacteria bacterium RIFCSPLOWO2_01_FULL_39_11 TaxID=1802295 RepID=A0A1G2LQT1_9BACT|nr:MAG: hypothetical protein A2909_01665 [Candidatus Tagabacteria bacterium RIFCSPLOWO2_01_FULL_39_11]